MFEILYEWKPIVCNVYHTLDHATADGHKAVVWRPKEVEVATQEKEDILVADGFTQRNQRTRRASFPGKKVEVGNSFAALTVDGEEIVIGDVVCERRATNGRGEGDPPDGHG